MTYPLYCNNCGEELKDKELVQTEGALEPLCLDCAYKKIDEKREERDYESIDPKIY